jgi:coenzyme PQQ synthesis protein D (PqqD)
MKGQSDANLGRKGWSPGQDVVAEIAGERLVLIHLATNRIFELNRTGARVWELLREGEDEEGMVRRMLEEFEVDEERLRQEIRSVVGHLVAEKLVVPNG